MNNQHFDVVIIGSGFGGSVSALRLTEKGYRVAVLEAGARYEDHQLPKTSWRIRKFIFMPRLGLRGIQRIHFLKDVVVLAGAGVGGGSLNYANTLYQPGPEYFQSEQWAHITDWEAELAPWYDQARRMLGVVPNQYHSPADSVMQSVANRLGQGDTFTLTPVGVFFGEGPGVESPDPFFGGVGPARIGCINCGECMTGCRFDSKNTLLKNYLGLAEKAGAKVFPLSTVTELTESESGWRISVQQTGRWVGGKSTLTADQVIVAAGTYNTQKLLLKMRDSGRLPRLSKHLGQKSRTNSEALVGAVAKSAKHDFTRGTAITSSFYVNEHTHIEPCRYGRGSNLMALLATIITDGNSAPARISSWLKNAVLHPIKFARSFSAYKWSERTIIALVMQDLKSHMTLVTKRTPFGRQLFSRRDADQPTPKFIAEANLVAREIAREIDGDAMGTIADLVGAPFTAHFVGGCVIGDSPETGSIDAYHRVWNYPNLHVVDGSTISANLGVNPSLTITAQAERALSMWPNKGEVDLRPVQGSEYVRVAQVFPQKPVVPNHAPAALVQIRS